MADFAKAGKVTFTPKAERQYRALGYTREQALECIAWLDPCEYRMSLRYTDTGMEWDDYVTKHRGPDGVVREIYIKLRIPTPSSVDYVTITSFHTQAPLDP